MLSLIRSSIWLATVPTEGHKLLPPCAETWRPIPPDWSGAYGTFLISLPHHKTGNLQSATHIYAVSLSYIISTFSCPNEHDNELQAADWPVYAPRFCIDAEPARDLCDRKKYIVW